PISRVSLIDKQAAAQCAFQMVGMSRDVSHDYLQQGIRYKQIELVSGAMSRSEIKVRRAVGRAAIKISARMLQRQMFSFPMQIGDRVAQGELRPLKRASVELEMQIGVGFVVDRTDAINPGQGWPPAALWLNNTGKLRP